MEVMDKVKQIVEDAFYAGKAKGREELLEEQQSDIRYKAGLDYIAQQTRGKDEPHTD